MGVENVNRKVVFCVPGALSLSCSSFFVASSEYDSKGKSVMSTSERLNVWACSPSLGDAGASDVVFRDAKGNALGFVCSVLGSSNLSMCFSVRGIVVRLRSVSGEGAIEACTQTRLVSCEWKMMVVDKHGRSANV